MKKIFVMFCLLFSSGLTGSITVLKEDISEVVLRLTAPNISLNPIVLTGTPYLRLEIPEALHDTKPGDPEIPFFRVHVRVPLGKNVLLELVNADYQGRKLNASLSPLTRIPVHDGTIRFVPINASAYERVYGERPVELEELGFAGHDKIAVLRWMPVRYDAAQNILALARYIKIRVRFLDDASLSHERSKGSLHSVTSWFVVNPNPAGQDPRAKKTDLVISHESYRNILSPFLEWKRQAGHEVREYFVRDKSSSEIRAIILKEYGSANPPTSTLLVGNIDQLPSWRGTGDNRWTDFNYQVLDSDKIPDLSLGRIPAQSPNELKNLLNKVMSREISPRDVNDVLLTAGRDTGLGCPQNASKVGDKLLSSGNPAKLRKKYRTQVSSQEVWDAYNTNPNLIVYDGHGTRQGMTEIPLLISNLDRISNTSFPILLDIACLNANWGSSGASPRNFAETFLLEEGRGLAGILASGGSGFGHQFFQTIGEIMAQARKQLNTEPLSNEIGRIVWAAKVKGAMEDRAFWNYYGDPTSSVWESTM